MPIAYTVQQYLEQHQVPFDLVTHRRTVSSLRSADRAHIEPSCLAKAVLLENELEHSHFLMAIVPATHRVQLAELTMRAGRALHLASEEDAAGLFTDCEAGAIPPLGPAYGVETIWEDSLMQQPDLYFEAGDHEHLVHVKARDFVRLLPGCPHGQFAQQA